MIMAKTAKTMAMVAMATGTLGAWGCAPEAGTCSTDSECAFGTTCSEDGVCAQVYGDGGGGGGVARDGMAGVGGGVMGGDSGFVSGFSTTGIFDGTIGGAAVRAAVIDVTVYTSGAQARFTAEGRASTFVVLNLPDTALLSVPGTTSVTATMDGVVWAQACNYDSASYDESFEDFEIEVSEPRAPTAEDPIIAEDAPSTEVVDVTVTTVGEGSNVTTTFVLPATL